MRSTSSVYEFVIRAPLSPGTLIIIGTRDGKSQAMFFPFQIIDTIHFSPFRAGVSIAGMGAELHALLTRERTFLKVHVFRVRPPIVHARQVGSHDRKSEQQLYPFPCRFSSALEGLSRPLHLSNLCTRSKPVASLSPRSWATFGQDLLCTPRPHYLRHMLPGRLDTPSVGTTSMQYLESSLGGALKSGMRMSFGL